MAEPMGRAALIIAMASAAAVMATLSVLEGVARLGDSIACGIVNFVLSALMAKLASDLLWQSLLVLYMHEPQLPPFANYGTF